MKYLIVLVSCFLFAANAYGQAVSTPNVDSIILSWNLRSYHDFGDLADTLTSSFNNDSEKVRAIYIWITQNIAYDIEKSHLDQSISLETTHTITKDGYIDIEKENRHTIVSKKGICQDYAELFYDMCKSEKIKCAIISGFGASFYPNWLLALQAGPSNHVWNAVEISGKWHLLDLTWASGGINGDRFVRNRNDHYYFTPPEIFIKDHFPTDENWQLINPPIDRKTFIKLAKQN